MSWFKHENEGPTDYSYKQKEVSQVSAGGGSFFTDPQSYNENSRAVKTRSAMKNEFKNDFLMHQQMAEKKREEKLEAKRFNPEKVYEQQVNERREYDEKQDEKYRKLEKQRNYQMQLQQQMQDNFDRKQAQRVKDNEDSSKYRSPFNSGVPQYTRDITNQDQLEALEVEKRNRKEKQDMYARQLSAQLSEQQEKKAFEKHQRRSGHPGSNDMDSLEMLKRQQDQIKREYADSLQEHVTQQNSYKQQQKEKERSDQNLTGLDIQGSYKFNGPTKEQLRADLLNQIKQKEYAKKTENDRNPYEKSTPADYDRNPYEKGASNPYEKGTVNPYEKNVSDYDRNPYAQYDRNPYEKNAPVDYRDPYEKNAPVDYDRNPYEKNAPLDYDYYGDIRGQNPDVYAGGYKDSTSNQSNPYVNPQPLAGRGSNVKENAAGLDIFGNPTRQYGKPSKQAGDFDIFGNPVKKR